MSFVINPYVYGAGSNTGGGGGGGGGTPPPTGTFDPATDTLDDPLAFDTAIIEFLYAGAGQAPTGPNTYVDQLAQDADIINFSYTI
jgi:hypothetical protein